MQHLPEREAERLSSIVSVWKEYRDELVRADVRPICEEPSGVSLTGFAASADDALHLILLREVTDRDTFTVEIGEDFSAPVLIASNADTEMMLKGGTLTVRLSSPRAYAWIRIPR